jgi:hypothetical protein
MTTARFAHGKSILGTATHDATIFAMVAVCRRGVLIPVIWPGDFAGALGKEALMRE